MEAKRRIIRENPDTAKESWTITYTVKNIKNNSKACGLVEKFDGEVVKSGGQTTLDDDAETNNDKDDES